MTLNIGQTVIACLVLHVLADFPLQTLGTPSLADLKQKSWWGKLLYRATEDAVSGSETAKRAHLKRLKRKYGSDYKAALLGHSLMWSALTFMPLCTSTDWSMLVAVNAGIHYLIDDLKANHLEINLVTDQVLHGWQIGLTLGWYFFVKFITGG